jgi:hypothetical protein
MSLYKKIILGLIFCSNVFLGCAKSKAFIGVQLDRYNLVENVMTNKPADLAGIRPRDIILGIEKDKNWSFHIRKCSRTNTRSSNW